MGWDDHECDEYATVTGVLRSKINRLKSRLHQALAERQCAKHGHLFVDDHVFESRILKKSFVIQKCERCHYASRLLNAETREIEEDAQGIYGASIMEMLEHSGSIYSLLPKTMPFDEES